VKFVAEPAAQPRGYYSHVVLADSQYLRKGGERIGCGFLRRCVHGESVVG